MKRTIIALVIGLLIGAAGTAVAQTETVQANLAKFVFVVNGAEQKLDADPLVYQGTTYLPVRNVANLLGYDVTYRADERKIELKKAAEPQERRKADMEKTVTINDWQTLNEIAKKHGLFISVGNEVIIGDIKFPRPNGEPDRTEAIETERGILHLKIDNGLFLISEEELIELGIIDQ